VTAVEKALVKKSKSRLFHVAWKSRKIPGTDRVRQVRFNAAWQFPDVRFCHRLVTTV
jgi:hypothetical protein